MIQPLQFRSTDSPRHDGHGRRRASILIFALGVLVLLALIGIGLLATTNGDQARMRIQRAADTLPNVLDTVISSVQIRLRQDLWNDRVGFGLPPEYLSASPHQAPIDAIERNETFDAPSAFDRWLSSALPYRQDELPPSVNPIVYSGGEMLAWPRVSYVGSDLQRNNLLPGVLPFAQPPVLHYWAMDSRTGTDYRPLFQPGLTPTPLYGDPDPNDARLQGHSLEHVMVDFRQPDYGAHINMIAARPVRTYIPNAPSKVVPGSTTNVTIAEARDLWYNGGLAPPQGANIQQAEFPYFDTNMDGVLDLYDADGDGVPDSPLSFHIPYSRRRADDPAELYAAVRIVDNASMINVGTACAFDTNGDGAFNNLDLFGQNALLPDQQLRGRRVCEVLMDSPMGQLLGLAQSAAVDDADRTSLAALLNYRANSYNYLRSTFAGRGFYDDVVRRILVGGLPPAGLATPYPTFGLSQEMSLRTRFSLAEYEGPNPTGANRLAVAERGMPATMNVDSWRWAKYSNYSGSDYQVTGAWVPVAALDPENVGVASVVPFSRRLLFTTNSVTTDRMPQANFTGLPGLSNLRLDIGGPPPLSFPVAGLASQREKVDLNPTWVDNGAGTRVAPTQAQVAEYIARLSQSIYTSAAIWGLAVDPRLPTRNDCPPNAANPAGQAVDVRPCPEDVAWQLAVNIVDFIDGDDTPTVVIDPLTSMIQYVGIEAQPFISKYGARFKTDAFGMEIPAERRFAVELVYPYPSLLPAGEFSIQVHSGASVTTFALPAFNPGSTSSLTRVVLLNDATNITLSPGTTVSTDVNFHFDPNDQIVLVRRLTTAAGVSDWPVDEAEVGSFTPANGNDETQCSVFRRDENDWRFTVGRDLKDPNTEVANLNLTNPADLSAQVAPSQWFNRSYGWLARNFESPAEISRLLAVGTVRGRPGGPVTPGGYDYRTPPRYLAQAQFGLNGNIGAGRIDFFPSGGPDTNAGAILDALTCTSLQSDFIDNDGDAAGLVDQPGEAAAVAYREAGRINVNTAPAAVLRAVPFMNGMDPVNNWDCAAGIVAFREGRDVPAILPPPTVITAPGAGLGGFPVRPRHFRALSDLLRVRFNPARPLVEVGRFATDASDLPPNDLSIWSPDFDAGSALDDAASCANDIRERDILLARWSNILTTRSDVFTVYIALMDDRGRCVRRSQFTIDRSACAAEDSSPRAPVLPSILGRIDTDYDDETR